jgi:hypothetical protein
MFSRRAAVLAAIAALTWAGGGCRKARPPGKGNGPLALFPADTQVVVGVDVASLRRAPAVASWLGPTLASSKELAAFTRETGLDPWRQLDSIAIGMPSADADVAGIVVRAQRLDEARLIAYLRKLNVDHVAPGLVSKQRGRHTFWSSADKPRDQIVFLDQGTLIIGVGGWAETMVDLSDGTAGARSAANNAELAQLVNGVSSHTVWAAGLLSDDMRAKLAELAPHAPGLAKLRTATVSIDADADLAIALTAALPTPADAQALVALGGKQLAAFGAGGLKLSSEGSLLRGETRVDAKVLSLLRAVVPLGAALEGNVPPMRRYAEKVVAASGTKLTVSRCEMFDGTRKGFCIVEGAASEIAALPVRLHMSKRPPSDVRFGQTCAALEEFGHADGSGHAFKPGVREFAAKGALPSNTNNVKFVALFAGQTSACIELEYPYG